MTVMVEVNWLSDIERGLMYTFKLFRFENKPTYFLSDYIIENLQISGFQESV